MTLINLDNFMTGELALILGGLMMTVFIQAFISNRKHLLATLLSLEGLMLSIFFVLSMCTLLKGYALYQLLFLTLVACEGALGLTLLMSIVRTHGGDCFNSMSSLKC